MSQVDMATKLIWTYWHQGWEQAPEVVKRCHQSWIRWNPDYAVHALDQHTLFQHVDFPAGVHPRRRDLTIQKMSALGRLALLSRYGGVWADATVMCTRGLSDWLGGYYDARFFAFRKPGEDRLMSNWFMAAEPESLIIQRLRRRFFAFYEDTYFWNQGTPLGDMLLDLFSRRWCVDARATLNWHSWFARKILRVYPYFIFHYTCNQLLLGDPECAALWTSARPFSAEPPHRLQAFQTSPSGIAEAMTEIESGLTPMYKLDWRIDSSTAYWAAVLRRLDERS